MLQECKSSQLEENTVINQILTFNIESLIASKVTKHWDNRSETEIGEEGWGQASHCFHPPYSAMQFLPDPF